ncbi:MAG: SDR family oxidoreductase [Gemmatimonadota bacterium]|nr:SDR family oxidoreductase [Gemmatimonadota bacterium]
MDKPIAVITGASRGIGRATALRLAERYDIVAVARTATDLETLAEEIGVAGGRCTPVAVDLRDGAGIARALGSVDAEVLVNNAGLGIIKPLLDLGADEWHQQVDVNLNALFHVTKALLPKMIARGRGDVINIGSIAGRSAFVGGSCYAATKWAVMAFSESLMLEVRDAGVRVSVIMPGGVDTNFSTSDRDSSWKLSAGEVADAVWYNVSQPRDVLVHRLEIRAARSPKK